MIDVFSQGYEAALLFCIGVATGLLYRVITWIESFARPGSRHALDALLLLLGAGLLALGALLANSGRMRAFFVLFDALGAVLTAWAFEPVFRRNGKKAASK